MLKDMWINDLTQFLIVADKIEEEEEKERLMEQSKINTDKGKKARKRNDK